MKLSNILFATSQKDTIKDKTNQQKKTRAIYDQNLLSWQFSTGFVVSAPATCGDVVLLNLQWSVPPRRRPEAEFLLPKA